jgi:hypothetical protein
MTIAVASISPSSVPMATPPPLSVFYEIPPLPIVSLFNLSFGIAPCYISEFCSFIAVARLIYLIFLLENLIM